MVEKEIYLIMSIDEGYYKIGISKNPQKRLKQLQTASSSKLNLIETYKSHRYSKIEKALHRLFNHGSKIGEWFDLDIVDVNKFKEYCMTIDNNLSVLEEHNNNFI
ncbi:MAG: GIY-YIG nuclease family protein [bacterium]